MHEPIDPEGQRRIAQLVAKALKTTNPKPERTMPKSGETRAVREVKEAMAKAKAKRTKAVEKPVDQNATLDTPQCPIVDRKPTVSIEPLIGHSTVSSVDTQEFPITRIEHYKESIKESKKKEVNKSNTVLGNLEVQDFDFLIDAGLKPEQVEEYASTLLPLFQAEGIKPTSRVLTDSIMQLHRDTR